MTVRLDATTYQYIRSEAANAGVSVAQFIREAAVMRAVIRSVRRETPGLPMDYAELAEAVERLARMRRRRR